jgi:starch synthase
MYDNSYKFLVDDQWVCSEEDNKDNDIYGNINNYIMVE